MAELFWSESLNQPRCPDLTKSPRGWLQCLLVAGHESDPLSLHSIDTSGAVVEDSRVTKLATHYATDRGVRFLPRTFSSEELVEIAKNAIGHVEAAGLVVTDPLAAPYSLVTHEYPPTLELAKAQIEYLANTNHALHMHLVAAWEKGYRSGWADEELALVLDSPVYKTPNPYKQETNDG